MSTGLCKATNSFVCKYRSDACMSQDGSRSKQFFAVQIRSGGRTLKDWFGGSLEEENMPQVRKILGYFVDLKLSLATEIDFVAAIRRGLPS